MGVLVAPTTVCCSTLVSTFILDPKKSPLEISLKKKQAHSTLQDGGNQEEDAVHEE